MKVPVFNTAEELVAFVQQLLQERKMEEAAACVENVDEKFTENAIAQHLAGLVHERTYLEEAARGQSPPLDLYSRAERHYRKAFEVDPANAGVHGPRLYTALFVLGTQTADVKRLDDARRLAGHLKESTDPQVKDIYSREEAIATTALARATGEEEDWRAAEKLFDQLKAPESGREAFFFHFYRGMTKRERGQSQTDEQALREAIRSFRHARAEQKIGRAHV